MTTIGTRRYAEGTKVSSSSSMEQIKALLKRFGADNSIGVLENPTAVSILFDMNGSDGVKRNYRFTLYLPATDEEAFPLAVESARATKSMIPKTKAGARDKEVGRLHRALLMMIKGMLVGVESQIQTVEQAFYPQTIVTKDGRTLYEETQAKVTAGYVNGHMPELLPGLPPLDPSRPMIERRIGGM